jgi:intracellular septation protein A
MISLLEWLPLTVFFIAYHYLGLYAATAGIMIASIVQLALYTIQGKSISLFQWVSLLFLGIMGSATLFFKNVLFIKWKPTLVYWLFSSACLLSPYYSKKKFSATYIRQPTHFTRYYLETFKLLLGALFRLVRFNQYPGSVFCQHTDLGHV